MFPRPGTDYHNDNQQTERSLKSSSFTWRKNMRHSAIETSHIIYIFFVYNVMGFSLWRKMFLTEAWRKSSANHYFLKHAKSIWDTNNLQQVNCVIVIYTVTWNPWSRPPLHTQTNYMVSFVFTNIKKETKEESNFILNTWLGKIYFLMHRREGGKWKGEQTWLWQVACSKHFFLSCFSPSLLVTITSAREKKKRKR